MDSSVGVIIPYEGVEISVVSDSDWDNIKLVVDNVEIIPVVRVDSVTGVSTYAWINFKTACNYM